MGSYGTLIFAECEIDSFKNHLPLEALLLFTADDLHIGEEATGAEVYGTCAFVTSALAARQRLDARGVTPSACRHWFDLLRADEITYFHPVKSTDGSTLTLEQRTLPVEFDLYVGALHGTVTGVDDGEGPAGAVPSPGPGDGAPLEDYPFFAHDALTHFSDVIACIRYRMLLESLPDTARVILDFSDLFPSGWLEVREISNLFDHYLRRMLLRLTFDYKLYGFVIEQDPGLDAKLRARLAALDEDRFIIHVLRPLLQRMGFERVRAVAMHGQGEFGADIGPFRHMTPFGTVEYYALQAKAVPIHGSAAKPGNAAELISQAMQAFTTPFIDDLDNERKRINKFVIATNTAVVIKVEPRADSRRPRTSPARPGR
jgi:hypothetical protein